MTWFLLKELRSNDLRTAGICISRFERTQNAQTTDKGGYMQDDAQFPSSIFDDQSSTLPARSPKRDATREIDEQSSTVSENSTITTGELLNFTLCRRNYLCCSAGYSLELQRLFTFP